MAEQKYILIVDDEATLRQSLSSALDEIYVVKTADDGQSGLELALSTHPDLIILDYKMPGMDGLAMLDKLREDEWGRTVPVIFATNSYDLTAINAVMAHDVKDYIIKSDIALEALRDQIARHLG